MKEQILAALEAQGAAGLTPDEYADRTQGLINTVRRRFTDLWKEGKIKPTEQERSNAAGNATTVWSLGFDPEGAIDYARPTRAELRAAVDEIASAFTKTGGGLEPSPALIKTGKWLRRMVARSRIT